MNPEAPGPGPAVPPGPEPTPPPPGSTPAPGLAPSPPPAPGGAEPWGGWLWGGSSSRDARRAERHARREARRAERGMGGPFWGVLFVVAGAAILASELIPGFDWDLAWPALLIGLGILLVVASIRRPPAGP